MSDQPFMPPMAPLMTPERARDTGRKWKAMADYLAEAAVVEKARYAERQSQWWLTYSVALAAKPQDGRE